MQPRYLPPSSNPRVADAAHPFYHAIGLQTRFSDYDMLGHLNNNVYLTFMDMAKARYFQAASPEPVDWKEAGVVVVNINCSFYAPSLYDEPLEALTAVTSIGNKSLTLEQRILNSATGETKCVGVTIMAGFDPATMTSAPIPAVWVELIEKFEHRKLTKD